MEEKFFGKIEQTPVGSNEKDNPTLKEVIDSAEKMDNKNEGKGTVVIENLGDKKIRAKLTSEEVPESKVEKSDRI